MMSKMVQTGDVLVRADGDFAVPYEVIIADDKLFVIGMIKKSVPMTIISALVFFYIRQFYIAGMDLYEENWLFVIGVVIITIIGVCYVLTHKINPTD